MVLFIRTCGIQIFRSLCTSNGTIMKILNVAEKNDAAKNIAFFLSGGNSTKVFNFYICFTFFLK